MKKFALLLIFTVFLCLSSSANKYQFGNNPSRIIIKINQTAINLQDVKNNKKYCFNNDYIEVRNSDYINIISATNYFVTMATTSYSGHYRLQYNYVKNKQITVNSMANAQKTKDGLYEAHLALQLVCKETDISAYYKVKTHLQINFYNLAKIQTYELHLLILCAKSKTVEQFNSYFAPAYVIFWMVMNLSILIYHNYPRKSEYFSLFMIYLFASLFITNQLLVYIFSGFYILLIVLKEKKENKINHKTYFLYLLFTSIVVLQIYLTYLSAKTNQALNGIWIVCDNFIITHIAMFLSLRLIKLIRFREVFWYFIAISLFSLLMQGNYNRFFTIQFKNIINLRCIKVDLFFPIMMLPISNFYSTIVGWMHRPFAIMIIVASALSLTNAIKFCGIGCCVSLLLMIWLKSIKIIQHKSE